ncbi:MAG TPA: sigma-70 family RNA polymerase sigma factor [Solirubrobacteraceae bacterium]|jgi:RNA polymerase sigma-70 factor (ECF subfamily)
MRCATPAPDHRTPTDEQPDRESTEWLRSLASAGPLKEAAVARLHELLLKAARSEVNRRRSRLGLAGPELDDIAHQAAADALMAITAKLGEFRGESRFTTWAYKFVILEVSTKIGRHFWRRRTVAMDAEDWERLPDRFGLDPAAKAEWHDLLAALRRAVDDVLSAHQRRIFVAIVIAGVPVDALALELATNRNAIYKTMFDARRKIRAELAANGYLDTQTPTARQR